MKLTVLAPGKINLGLVLGPVREDGRHQLVTVFESVSLADSLTLTERPDGGGDEVVCPGVEGPNLVEQALRGLRARGWGAPPVRIEIDKRIPVAAGMAGGSADAAAALRLAAALVPGRAEEIAVLAAQLGADVPGQLVPGVALGTGAGELVEPLSPLAEHAVAIVPGARPLPTPAVFGEADRLGLPRSAAALEAHHAALLAALGPGARLADALLINDLEPAAVSLCPEIADALHAIRAHGADTAFLCGSGPTVAGLFWGASGSARADAAAVALAERFPGAVAAVPVAAEAAFPRPSEPVER